MNLATPTFGIPMDVHRALDHCEDQQGVPSRREAHQDDVLLSAAALDAVSGPHLSMRTGTGAAQDTSVTLSEEARALSVSANLLNLSS